MTHEPVLLDEVLELLAPEPGDFMIDGTMNGGGHADGILQKIGPRGKFLGVDLDPSMSGKFLARHEGEPGITAVHGNYADLPNILAEQKLPKANGLLLDLGFSSEQLEESGRGFSFLRDEPLLMTYDPAAKPLRELLARVSESELERIISEYGGERYARRVAKGIKMRNAKKKIQTTTDLKDVIRHSLPHAYERGRIDPATRTFQALRIWANGELDNVKRALANIPKVLAPGGRVVIISFHSLEDALVKNSFRAYAADGRAEILTKRPIEASYGEIRKNIRSRSAKLRAAVVIANNANNNK